MSIRPAGCDRNSSGEVLRPSSAVPAGSDAGTGSGRCFDHAEVELSDNLAENSMRPVALGRKNWLHVGSAKAGPKVAAIFSIVESCRRLGIPVKDYLLAVLPGMSQKRHSEVAQLTPAHWMASRGRDC
jgi:hypothetical protein